VRARKRFGQHFLEPPWVAKLIAVIAPRPEDTFLEIGPGRGALTAALASHAGRLLAVEIDRDLAAALPARMPETVRVIAGDFLDTDLIALLAGERLPVRVAANLPYNAATPILAKLLAAAAGGEVLADATLMLQKEVAERVVARPGSPDYGPLAVAVALDADAETLLTLPPGAFRPPPKVTSAVVRLRFRGEAVDVGDRLVFTRLVRGAFQQRRKMILNALGTPAAALGRDAADLLARAGVDPTIRPGDLTLEGFAALSRAVL